ncbi:MAG: hypothetical protein QXQ14_01285 [Candidatus Aenigmatarchaeota archaeon]
METEIIVKKIRRGKVIAYSVLARKGSVIKGYIKPVQYLEYRL